jgi:hypothetical protein
VPPSRSRLPFRFDAAALQADVDGLLAADWIPHFNTSYYEGDWSGVALRAVGGVADRLYPDPAATDGFADTPVLARCPNARAALEAFRCPLLAVRFLRLGPRSRIREHTDYNLSVDDGEVRIHVPVTTNPGVEFHLDGAPVDMVPGEVWYLDLNLRHAVVNAGAVPRVHLVVDCVVDSWLRDLIISAA